MNKIKKKLIHFLGGLTQDEHDNLISLADKAHSQSLTRLNEENERLQRNLRALEWAVEDSHSVGLRTIATIEKPIHTIKIENIILEEVYDTHTADEIIERTKQYMGEQILHTLMESKLIEFRMSDDFEHKKMTGIVYVREP